MRKILQGWLPGVLASQIALCAMALFVAVDRLRPGGTSPVVGIQTTCLFLVCVFGAFLLCGTVIGILEYILFRLGETRGKAGKKGLRLAVYAVAVILLVIAPFFPFLEAVNAHRTTLDGWALYLAAALLSAIIAAIVLKIWAGRCAGPVRLLLSAVIAAAIFYLAAGGTSLFFLLRFHFRPVQLAFYLMIWWGAFLSLGLLYPIGHLRKLLSATDAERIPPLFKIAGLVICPVLAAGLYRIDSTVYVGLYGGAHLFVRVLAYLLLDIFALTLILTTKLATARRRTAAVPFSLSVAVIALAVIVSCCFDLRPAVKSETSIETRLTWPLVNAGYTLSGILTRDKEVAQAPAVAPLQRDEEAEVPPLSNIPRPETPRVFIIIIDALRADHLSCNGYERTTTPNIDRLADSAANFRYCIAPGLRTSVSMSQIFTSRTFLHLAMVAPLGWRLNVDTSPTLAEVLRRHSFYTLGLGWLIGPHLGYSKGFDEWRRCTDSSLLTEVRKRIGMIRKGKSFCYFHYMDLHDSLDPKFLQTKKRDSPAYRETYRALSFGGGKIDKYDTTLKVDDRKLGELMEYLKKEGVYDESVIILTGDHGLSLGEQGIFGQARGYYNPEVLVPLIIKAPGFKPAFITETVGAIDIFPTILDLVGIEMVAGIEGRSLVPLMAAGNKPVEPDRPYFHFVPKGAGAVIKGDFKLVRPGLPRSQLYAFKDDPLEEKNLVNDLPEVAGDLRKAWEEMAKTDMIVKPLPPAASSPGGLRAGLERKVFDNPRFSGNPVSETIVAEDLRPYWDISVKPPPKEGFSIQWDGFIALPKRRYKDIIFSVAGKPEVEMWIDGVKFLDATAPQRSHHPREWHGYIPLEDGIHSWRIRLSEKKNARNRAAFFYHPDGKRNPIPPTAVFHKP